MSDSELVKEIEKQSRELAGLRIASRRRGDVQHVSGGESIGQLEAAWNRFTEAEKKGTTAEADDRLRRFIVTTKALFREHLTTVTSLGDQSHPSQPTVYVEYSPGSQRYFAIDFMSRIKELKLEPGHQYQFREWDAPNKKWRERRVLTPSIVVRPPSTQASIGHRVAAIYGIHRQDWLMARRRI